ncbi:hypothetical protein Tco_1446993 [Tanacetum coccineum]
MIVKFLVHLSDLTSAGTLLIRQKRVGGGGGLILFNSVQVVRLACSFPIGVPVKLLGLLALAMTAVCASTAVVRSAISCRMASKVMAGVSDVDILLGGILSTEDNT